jgi:hypothetical protein
LSSKPRNDLISHFPPILFIAGQIGCMTALFAIEEPKHNDRTGHEPDRYRPP